MAKMTPEERLRQAQDDWFSKGLKRSGEYMTVHARVIREAEEEARKEGFEAGKAEARLVVGSPLTEAKIEEIRKLLPGPPYGNWSYFTIIKLLNHIDFMMQLFADLQEDQPSYARGVEDGKRLALEEARRILEKRTSG